MMFFFLSDLKFCHKKKKKKKNTETFYNLKMNSLILGCSACTSYVFWTMTRIYLLLLFNLGVVVAMVTGYWILRLKMRLKSNNLDLTF